MHACLLPSAHMSCLQVHKAVPEEYGEPFREGDVIGCLIHLPPGGRPFEYSKQVPLPAATLVQAVSVYLAVSSLCAGCCEACLGNCSARMCTKVSHLSHTGQ